MISNYYQGRAYLSYTKIYRDNEHSFPTTWIGSSRGRGHICNPRYYCDVVVLLTEEAYKKYEIKVKGFRAKRKLRLYPSIAAFSPEIKATLKIGTFYFYEKTISTWTIAHESSHAAFFAATRLLGRKVRCDTPIAIEEYVELHACITGNLTKQIHDMSWPIQKLLKGGKQDATS